MASPPCHHRAPARDARQAMLPRRVTRAGVDCAEEAADESIRADRPVSRERGGQVRVRGPRRGDPRHRGLHDRLERALHPHPARAGRRVHGRRLRTAHRPRGGLSRHAGPRRHQPGHRGGRRQPRSRAAGGHHRAGGPRPRPQGVAPVRRHRRAHAPAHQVEHARRDAGGHPRGHPQGLQGRRGREAGRLPHRGARGRGGGGGRGRAALHRAARGVRRRTARRSSRPRDSSRPRRSRSSSRATG